MVCPTPDQTCFFSDPQLLPLQIIRTEKKNIVQYYYNMTKLYYTCTFSREVENEGEIVQTTVMVGHYGRAEQSVDSHIAVLFEKMTGV